MEKRILCFGDSNTWGAVPGEGTRHPKEVRWTGVLQRELGEAYLVIEEGCNGRTTVHEDKVEGRLSGIEYFGPCCASQSPLDLIILMLGTNDLKVRFGVDAETIAYGLGRYLDVLRITPMAGRSPKILLTSPILIDPSYKEHRLFGEMFGDNAVERSKKLGKAYETFAAENHVEYFNAADYGRASARDGVHMEAHYHERLGMAFVNKVKSILG